MIVHRRVTRWGNGFGIRITKREAERLGIEEGDEIDVELLGRPSRAAIEKLGMFRFGGDYDIDEILDRDLMEEHGGGR